MQAPEKIEPRNLGDYLEIMSKAVFQSGISWKVVYGKWPGTRHAFHDFDPNAVARMTENDIEDLTKDTRIIRNRRKIEAVIQNAQRMLELEARHGGFRNYLRSFRSFEDLAADLRRQFKFLGDTGIYYFLWVVGEPVPTHDEWSALRTQRR